MKTSESSARVDRRTAIQWMLTAAATISVLDRHSSAAEGAAKPVKAAGYGPDPSMVKFYQPGDIWPLTLTEAQRQTTRALCDIIIPADETSPSASAVGVPDFIDEWISSPYPAQAGDRKTVLGGLQWIEEEAQRRFGKPFAILDPAQHTAICDDICSPSKAKPEHKSATAFFKRFRDLTAGGYYTTAEGMKAIGYVGNVPLPAFEGPPIEALRHVGLAE